MKLFTNSNTIKKVIIAILLVMAINFISPITVHADDGGDLFEPICELLQGVGDLVIKGLQRYFIGVWDIKYGGIKNFSSGTFYIRYSPGVIFSNRVAGLKVNFIDAKKSDEVTTPDESYSWDNVGKKETVKQMTTKYGYNEDEAYLYESSYIEGYYAASWRNGEDKYIAVREQNVEFSEEGKKEYNWLEQFLYLFTEDYKVGEEKGEAKDDPNLEPADSFNVYKFNGNSNFEVTKQSSAYLLQDTVATWYKALRAIALVGLLSILVYVGIRILISSTGQEKAKYKKMIMDWLVAICILFILQYIMIFITEIADKVTNILSVNIIGEAGEDILMSDVRNQIEMDRTFTLVFAELLIYLVLVIYTLVFTVQYLKRLIYMAFFTIIAPLIALTYPLDKIKDGQAQAFSIWIREYTFNALLQPMHLLIYYIFVGSATGLVNENPIYAVVAIGFMMPAEKFFRKMFGFDKAESSSAIGAAAGGALIMNAINKMGHGGGKHAAGGKGGTEGAEGSGGNSTPRYVPGPNEKTNGDTSESSQMGPQPYNGQSLKMPTFGQTIEDAQYGTKSKINGARTLKGHYFNKANGRKLAKGAGRWTRKAIVGAAGAATLGTIGLAAGIATGDASKAFSYGAVGAGAGYMGANALGDKALAFEKKNREIFKEGALGTEEYNTRNSMKELNNDNDFNRAYKSLKNAPDKEELIRQFHSNGITSSSDIKKSVNIMSKTGASIEELIAVQKINQQAKRYGMKRKDIEENLTQKGVTGTKLKKAMDLMDQL